jgi:hypothetical protein
MTPTAKAAVPAPMAKPTARPAVASASGAKPAAGATSLWGPNSNESSFDKAEHSEAEPTKPQKYARELVTSVILVTGKDTKVGDSTCAAQGMF